ncbi:MAG: hypothetical protein PHV60_08025 [bacterium]|nr:hypothetical protein [bacterium]
MRTLLFSFLIIIMVLAIYGSQAGKLTGILTKNINQDPARPAVLDQHQLNELIKKQATAIEEEEKQLDPEVQRMLAEINKENVVVLNPIMQKMMDLGKTSEPGTASALDQIKDFEPKNYIAKGIVNLEQLNPVAGKYFCLAAFIVFLLVLLTRFNSFSIIGYVFANTGFIVSRTVIFVAAISAIAVHFSLKFNVLTNLGSLFLWGPLILMAISAMSLKIYDFNNPVWNRMFFSILWPITSGVIMHFA